MGGWPSVSPAASAFAKPVPRPAAAPAVAPPRRRVGAGLLGAAWHRVSCPPPCDAAFHAKPCRSHHPPPSCPSPRGASGGIDDPLPNGQSVPLGLFKQLLTMWEWPGAKGRCGGMPSRAQSHALFPGGALAGAAPLAAAVGTAVRAWTAERMGVEANRWALPMQVAK